ncbi:MAG: lytic murein transglycosylase, partial [Desulfuromonadales bacterium]|nr:lytic murein transglycosylase [Desulfuromonadales bacterium]NIS44416.1 lytic murein transglycosylase [Desulfuromonadales bacterium]
WLKLGFKEAGGLNCSEADLVVTGDGGEQAFLVCRNFKTLMRWNKSTWFALTVGQLADRIEEAGSQEGG